MQIVGQRNDCCVRQFGKLHHIFCYSGDAILLCQCFGARKIGVDQSTHLDLLQARHGRVNGRVP